MLYKEFLRHYCMAVYMLNKGLTIEILHFHLKSLMFGAPVAQWGKRWPTDLPVVNSSPV